MNEKEIIIHRNGARTRIHPAVTGKGTRSDYIRDDDPAIPMVADAANQGFRAGYDAAIDKIASG
jgi:hypothetical protein